MSSASKNDDSKEKESGFSSMRFYVPPLKWDMPLTRQQVQKKCFDIYAEKEIHVPNTLVLESDIDLTRQRSIDADGNHRYSIQRLIGPVYCDAPKILGLSLRGARVPVRPGLDITFEACDAVEPIQLDYYDGKKEREVHVTYTNVTLVKPEPNDGVKRTYINCKFITPSTAAEPEH